MFAPYQIDGVKLTDFQRADFDRTFNLLLDAQHSATIAFDLASKVFRRIYNIVDNSWKPLKTIHFTSNSGKIFMARSWALGKEDMGLIKVKKDKPIVEAGARNSKADLERIQNAILAMLSNLTKEEKEALVAKLRGQKNG